VETGFCILHECDTKPSQAVKALAAFHRRYDLDLASLEL
jgi:hypothetical protein